MKEKQLKRKIRTRHVTQFKQVYPRRYESRRSPKPELHQENKKYTRRTIFSWNSSLCDFDQIAVIRVLF